MKIEELTVEVRNSSLDRVGQITPNYLAGFTAVLRHNDVGSWSVTLPVGLLMAEALTLPGAGIVVTTAQGTLLSGPTTSVILNQSTADPDGSYIIQGVDDSIILQDRLAYPKPSTADVTLQTDAYDIRTGSAEDVIKQYVNVNIGPAAPAARKIASLSIPTSTGLGGTVDGSARFVKLQELLAGLADVGEVTFSVEQVSSGLVFSVTEPVDRSTYIRLDLQNGRLTRTEYVYAQPLTTRTIVGGSGDNAGRVFLEQSNTESLSAETLWGRRIEKFVDARGTDVEDELQAAGNEVLAKDGKTQISATVSPSDDQTMLYGVDWNLGDKVSVVIGEIQLVSVVTEVGILISPDGVRIGATIGEPRTKDYESQILIRQNDSTLRISKLERTK
jgi:hypothetical protein